LEGTIGEEEQRILSRGGDMNNPKSVEKIKRNSPCPCGSGKKWKRCCGK